jgi:PKD repeat protein
MLDASVGTVIKDSDGTWIWSFTTSDGPADSQTVTITATDEYGAETSAKFELNVDNVAPTIESITILPNVVQKGASISASASFTDPGVLDTHTAVWDWGDLSSNSGSVTESNGDGSVLGTHAYADAGIYIVTLTVTDKDGDADTATYEYVVVYDPSGGFVTGGGWINSPAGASTLHPDAVGKANFGFVSKYKKGATIPEGETEFQFKAGNLNFHSSSYEWLVVAGTKAIYKGEGTVDGAGNYGFMLSAIDGNKVPDKFRIKIWDKNSGDSIVYDNQIGDSETADPSTEIAGGSIVVHK